MKNYDQLTKIRATNNSIEKFNYRLLKQLDEVLKSLKKIRKEFSVEKTPTFHMISTAYDKILNLKQPNDDNAQVILILKKRFIRFLKEKFKVGHLHIIATLFSPCFRSGKFSYKKLQEESESLLDEMLIEVLESDHESGDYTPQPINQYMNSIFDCYKEKPSRQLVRGSEIHGLYLIPLPMKMFK